MEEYRDNNNDAVVDMKYTNTLDANGHVTKQATDVNNDGVIDKVESYTLDAQGRPEFIYVDNGANDVVDRIEGVTRNANGHIIQRDYYIGDTITTTPNAVRTYEVDANGQVLKELNDSNADGQVDSIVSYVKDIYGLNVEVQTDTNADGIIDSISYSEYDALGRESYRWNDANLDGEKNKPDTENIDYQYDVYGNLLYVKDHDIDTDKTMEIWREYNELGQVTKAQFDYDSTTSPGINEIYVYEYENTFGKVSKESYVYPSGDIGIITTFEYDSLGQAVYSFRDIYSPTTGTNYVPDGFVDAISVGGDVNKGGAYSSTVDLTSWLNEPSRVAMFDHSLRRITLSNQEAESNLILDKVTLKAFAYNTLLIHGDATDTVNFKDAQTEFAKIAQTTQGDKLYDQYTTQIDGETYTVQIHEDINVNFGA